MRKIHTFHGDIEPLLEDDEWIFMSYEDFMYLEQTIISGGKMIEYAESRMPKELADKYAGSNLKWPLFEGKKVARVKEDFKPYEEELKKGL